MIVALVPCAATEWRQEGRLLGRVELPMLAEGESQCARWADILRPLGVQKILHGPDELATRTAALLGKALDVPPKEADCLAEVDVGLWAGLTDADMEARYETAHHELCEAPMHVQPPGGESVEGAAERLRAGFDKCLKGNGRKAAAIAVVLRPVSLALMRCALEGCETARLWEMAQAADEPVIIHVGAEKRVKAAAPTAAPPAGKPVATAKGRGVRRGATGSSDV